MFHVVLLALAPLTSVGTSVTPGRPAGSQAPWFKPPPVLVQMKEILFTAAGPQDAFVPGNEPLLGGGSATTYCQATMNSFNTVASIGFTGSLDLSDGTFGLTTTGCPPVSVSFGMYTYGQVQTNVPFANGFLCISPFAPGIFNFTPQSLGSGTVNNSMISHPADWAAANFQPGSTWNFQLWYRNPAAGGANFNLSNGLKVVFAP